jgi:hypothetical protein
LFWFVLAYWMSLSLRCYLAVSAAEGVEAEPKTFPRGCPVASQRPNRSCSSIELMMAVGD